MPLCPEPSALIVAVTVLEITFVALAFEDCRPSAEMLKRA
jgi:hypothetical protein